MSLVSSFKNTTFDNISGDIFAPSGSRLPDIFRLVVKIFRTIIEIGNVASSIENAARGTWLRQKFCRHAYLLT